MDVKAASPTPVSPVPVLRSGRGAFTYDPNFNYDATPSYDVSDHQRESSRSDNHLASQGEYTPCFILTGLTTSKAITQRSAEGRLIRQPRGPHNANITQYSEPGKCDHHCRRQYYSNPENYGGPSYIVNWNCASCQTLHQES